MQPPHRPSSTTPARHPYACARCRMRRVKCDKLLSGCSKCSEIRVDCVYSARRPRQSQKPRPDQQTHQVPATQRSLLPAESIGRRTTDVTDSNDESRVDDDGGEGGDEDDIVIPRELRDGRFTTRFDFNNSDYGRLFVAKGKSRYIDAGKAHQVADLETVLTNQSHKSEGPKASTSFQSPTSYSKKWDSNILLGMSGPRQNLQAYHPSPGAIVSLWDYYVRHVDLLVKVIYKPDVEALVMKASMRHERINVSTEPLLFAVWFATVMTMSPEECWTLQNEKRDVLLEKYRFGLEKALAQAGWMTTQDVLVLQALTLLIVFAPGRSARLSWMLTGMALNIAQSMGLHRHGTSFSLNPVEIEVRRRIWWSLCQLDNRISSDCGLEPHIPLGMDTRLPLHINDSDLAAVDAEPATPRTDFTEMTISLIKIEMAQISLKNKRRQCETPPLSNDEVEKLIRDQINRYETLYVPCLNESHAIHRLCYLGARLIITKLWRMVYDVSERNKSAQKDEINDQLLSYHTDILQIAHQLPDRSRQFGWFFGCKYTQWHAMAYLMLGLCKYPTGTAADRAWKVLDAVFDDLDKENRTHSDQETGVSGLKPMHILRQPLLKLLARARAVREEITQTQNTHLRSDAPSTLDSGYETSGLTPSDRNDTSPQEHGLLGDPFLGSELNFGEDMNWMEIESWMQELCGECETQNQGL